MHATNEQQEICANAQDHSTSLMITAFAGTGKTTTLTMLAKALPVQPCLALAFNLKIKKELEKRFPKHFSVKTMNGLGHGAWGKAVGQRLELEEQKLGQLITQAAKNHDMKLGPEEWNDLRVLVTQAMQQGLVPAKYANARGLIPDEPQVWERIASEEFIDLRPYSVDLARAILTENVRLAYKGTISYDDQIYMPTLFGGLFPRFPLVLVDEAQDLSPLNHIMVKKCAAGRLIVVGDPKQSIYAFRGADHLSMEKLRDLRSEWIDLPLTTTFRCPHVVVNRQQDHAPGFTAAPSNPMGTYTNFRASASPIWTWAKVEDSHPEADAQIAILCRNMAPLMQLAFRLIRQKVGCTVAGRDIGKGLIVLSRKILADDFMSIPKCIVLINEWKRDEIAKAEVNDSPSKAAAIRDRADCLLAVCEDGGVATARELREAIDALFSRTSQKVILSTAHRSKGLEWDVVVHLDPWRIPSSYAKAAQAAGDERQIIQELNLKYVIETRSKHTLILADLEHFE